MNRFYNTVYNIILIGETGQGKSSLGNFILGTEDAFIVSDDSESCTTETIRKISRLDNEIGVVDTPGLQDSQGRDKIHYEQMLKIIKEMKNLNFILLVFNFTSPRFTTSIQFMIKFLCNVFPRNFAHHVGIVFTHYDHEYQIRINKKKKKDPREERKGFIKDIMELISQTTNEQLFLGPPIFYLDSYVEDENSKKELNRLIAFAKSLKPIEDIRQCKLNYKKEEEEFNTRTYDRVQGDYIITYTEKLKRIKRTDYNNKVTYSEWETLSVNTSTRSVPVRYETRYIEKKIDRDEDKKEEKKIDKTKEEEDRKKQKNDKLNEKRETCNKVINAGLLGTIGSALLTGAGIAITPFCPVIGTSVAYVGIAGIGASGATSLGGAVADTVYQNKMEK